MIKIENLCYNDILKNINFTIEKGEILAVIGKTGSGKTTLITHLNGIYKPTSGTIYYNGENIFDKKFNITSLRKKIGMVFQYPENQIFESTVKKEIEFAPKMLGFKVSDDDIINVLNSVGLKREVLDKFPFFLSGGEKRRVMLASVLISNPEILILDEPTQALDPITRDEFMKMFLELKKQGKTIVMVSHSMEEVVEFADRVVLLDKGRVVNIDKPENFFNDVDLLNKYDFIPPFFVEVLQSLKGKYPNINCKVKNLDEACKSILEMKYE